MPKYLVVPNTLLHKMTNTVLAFSDGSKQLATSAVYLLSYDNNGTNHRVSLMSTLCKLNVNAKAPLLNTVRPSPSVTSYSLQ